MKCQHPASWSEQVKPMQPIKKMIFPCLTKHWWISSVMQEVLPWALHQAQVEVHLTTQASTVHEAELLNFWALFKQPSSKFLSPCDSDEFDEFDNYT